MIATIVQRGLRATLVGAVVASTLVLGASAAGAASRHADSCTGTNTTVGSDYTFTGTNAAPGVSYNVAITMPNGRSFVGTATASSTGQWSEVWYANMAGTYTANVTLYKTGQYVSTCSLSVSA